MPKMKTRRAAKKRFKVSATGKISHKKTHSRHNMEHKTRKLKLSFRKDHEIDAVEVPIIKRMLGKR